MRLPTEPHGTITAPAPSAPPVSPPASAGERKVAVYQRDLCLHQLFEAQVARTPDAPCLQWGAEVLTYRSVNARANQLAHRLRQLGVGPETLVGVCLERSPALVIALYAILKAGGAYVPLDPSYPRERLEFMLADTNVPVLLTQPQLQSAIQTPPSTTVLCLDTEGDSCAAESTAKVDSGVTEDNLAYVIYTSGSTGKPKGVMIEHRGICNQLQWMQATYPLTRQDAVLLRTPFSFDLSLYEFFSPLLAGARLVMVDPEHEKDPAYLGNLIQQERVTTLFLVPSLLQMLLAEETFVAATTLRHIFCSGEALPFALQQHFFARLPRHVALHNLYGPTEASVECTYWDCERDTERNFVPIGRPITNYEIVILDEQRRVVPVGEVGELHIGGIGLARGYWNRPELTAEKFMERGSDRATERQSDRATERQGEGETERQGDRGTLVSSDLSVSRSPRPPLSPSPAPPSSSSRLYKTGDLARRHADGVLECLGRMDFQVKLRGHRIELGEIEAALLTHGSVRTCVVVVREDVPGDQRLVAYFTTNRATDFSLLGTDDTDSRRKSGPRDNGRKPVLRDLRAHLKAQLPEYMLPAAFVALEALPLLPNGKVDRKQLPAPAEAAREPAAEYVAPANETEQRLAQVWAEALHLQAVGVTENFFQLGGHSLLAARIFAALEKEFGQKLPLATLLQAPTIRQLAAALAAPQSWSSLVPLQPAGQKPPFFCIHAVGGNVLEYYELAQQMSPDQPFYALQAVGLDGKQPPHQTIEAMAAHYVRAIRQLQPTGPYHLGGRSFGGMVAYEMAQQLYAQGEEVALLALLDTDPIGWLKRFPWLVTMIHRARFLALRIKRHWRNLRGLSGHAKLSYLREKADYKKRKLDTLRWRLARLFPAGNEKPLSDALREVEEFNYQAARQYVPARYPGRVTFIYAQEEISTPENIFGWETLAAGGVEAVAVPGNHQSMIKVPQVHLLAEQLQACLTPPTK